MCFHAETKKVIVNAYVLKMYFHIYTHGAQKSRHSGYVSTKIGNAHVYPHEKS
jgi:hypothetical protein